jgi:RHS repeat-associated protein
MTRSDTRLLALPGTSKKVATHPVAQLSNEDIPVANLLQGTHRPLPPRTHTFHTSYDAAGKLIEEYSTIVASSNDAKVAYLTNDHLGSPRINTDANGNATARHDYRPFGEKITEGRASAIGYAGDTVRKQFTGYEMDGETDLEFAQARMHSNGQGRFTTADPLASSARPSNPQTLNRYPYVLNNPLVLVDRNGLDPTI